MIKWFVVAIVLFLFTLTTPTAFAQGVTRGGDTVCFVGSVSVAPNDTVKDVVLFGCGARIQTGARVTADVVSFGGEVVVEKGARIERNIVVFGAPLMVAGEVGRDIANFGGRVLLDSTAVVGGNLAAFGGLVEQREGAVVRGQITRGDRTFGTTFRSDRFPFISIVPLPMLNGGDIVSLTLFGFARGVFGALALAALGALTVVFLPSQTKTVGDVAQNAALPSLGAGCITFLAAPTLIVLLVILICTIPVAAVLALALGIAGVFGWIAVGRVVGERILDAAKVKEVLPIVAVILGVFLLALVSAVPLVGWLVWLFVATLGLGAVVLTRFGTRAYPAPAPVAPPAPSAELPPSTA